MAIIRAIYENGVFRPLAPVDLPEGSRVKLCNLEVVNTAGDDDMDAIFEILDRRHSTGKTDTAERHNEHPIDLAPGINAGPNTEEQAE